MLVIPRSRRIDSRDPGGNRRRQRSTSATKRISNRAPDEQERDRTRRNGTGTGTAGMRLSYSSINTYETCPAKFKFQYEDRIPSGTSPALAFGDSLHRSLHLFHDRPVPVPPSLDELHDMLEASWVSEGFSGESEEQMYRDHGRQVLAQYHRENAPSYRIPAALEFRFRIEVEGVELSGMIDRMDRLPGGGYEIIDYKTNRRLPPQSRIDQDLQLSVYHLAATADLGHRARAAHALLPPARPAHDDEPHGEGRGRAPSPDRHRRRADRGRQVRAAAEPALRLVRLPGVVSALPAPVREGAGRPCAADDRGRRRVDRAEAAGA